MKLLPLAWLSILLCACQQVPLEAPGAGAAQAASESEAALADPSGTVDVRVRILDSPSPHASLEALEADSAVITLSEPRLTVRPYEQASVSIRSQQSYVSRFEVERGERAIIADPVVDELEQGILLDLIPYPGADGLWSGWLRLTESSMSQLAEGELQIAGQPITVQLPEVTTWNSARVLPPSEEGRWIVNLGSRLDGRWRLLDVRMAPGPPISLP